MSSFENESPCNFCHTFLAHTLTLTISIPCNVWIWIQSYNSLDKIDFRRIRISHGFAANMLCINVFCYCTCIICNCTLETNREREREAALALYITYKYCIYYSCGQMLEFQIKLNVLCTLRHTHTHMHVWCTCEIECCIVHHCMTFVLSVNTFAIWYKFSCKKSPIYEQCARIHSHGREHIRHTGL